MAACSTADVTQRCTGIVSTLLKALVEEVRCCTVGPSQARVLESALRGVGLGVQGVLRGRDSQGVGQLLEDVLVSVAERTT